MRAATTRTATARTARKVTSNIARKQVSAATERPSGRRCTARGRRVCCPPPAARRCRRRGHAARSPPHGGEAGARREAGGARVVAPRKPLQHGVVHGGRKLVGGEGSARGGEARRATPQGARRNARRLGRTNRGTGPERHRRRFALNSAWEGSASLEALRAAPVGSLQGAQRRRTNARRDKSESETE